MNNYDDEADLRRLHTEEADGGGPLSSEQPSLISNEAMQYLERIKELQSELESKVKEIQTLDMAILGFTNLLEEEMKKGY